MANSLRVEGVHAGYGGVRVIEGLSLRVGDGETVALLGTNGNGKSTLMKCVMGMVRPTKGSVVLKLDDKTHDLTRLSTEQIVDLGVAMVPEGRRLFPDMTVLENLLVGSSSPAARPKRDENLAVVLDLFPKVRERKAQLAGTLSGGEQQMVAIARALMASPRLLLLDETSLGLAPIVVDEIFVAVRRLAAQGLTILVVEQNTALALEVADHGYVLEQGHFAMQGPASSLAADPRVRQAYLGI